jgi:hypothetical protein
MTLNIDQEYKALIPPLSAEEFAQLEANILRDGCTSPIVTWEETIIDGHNRYAICKKHDLPFKIITMEFDDRDAAMDWMDTNQLGRRNLSPVDFKLALGRRYNRTKKEAHGRSDRDFSEDQIDTPKTNTAAKLATQHGVSEATVKRAGKLAEAVEAHPEIKEAIASGKSIKEAMKEHEEPPCLVVNGLKEKSLASIKILQKNGMSIYSSAKMVMDRLDDNDEEFTQSLDSMIAYCQKRITNRK